MSSVTLREYFDSHPDDMWCIGEKSKVDFKSTLGSKKQSYGTARITNAITGNQSSRSFDKEKYRLALYAQGESLFQA